MFPLIARDVSISNNMSNGARCDIKQKNGISSIIKTKKEGSGCKLTLFLV